MLSIMNMPPANVSVQPRSGKFCVRVSSLLSFNAVHFVCNVYDMRKRGFKDVQIGYLICVMVQVLTS